MSKDGLPTVNIKGAEYVMVKDRITFFNQTYTNGSIRTEIVSYTNGQAVVKATIIPDVKEPERYFTGYSQAVENQGFINKTSALENAETSAVGRALAMFGIGIVDSVASADEMVKAGVTEDKGKPSTPAEPVQEESSQTTCDKCGAPATDRSGTSKTGRAYHGIFCSTGERSHVRWLYD